MTTGKDSEVYVRVKDMDGNEFLCPFSALKDPKEATDEELSNCVDSATTQRYSGHIDIKD
jgi:hypothetical protein